MKKTTVEGIEVPVSDEVLYATKEASRKYINAINMKKPVFEIQEVTFESDIKKQLSYGKEKRDWSYLFILAIGMALGVLLAHPLVISNI